MLKKKSHRESGFINHQMIQLGSGMRWPYELGFEDH